MGVNRVRFTYQTEEEAVACTHERRLLRGTILESRKGHRDSQNEVEALVCPLLMPFGSVSIPRSDVVPIFNHRLLVHDAIQLTRQRITRAH